MAASTPLKVLQLGSPAGLYGAERWILALVKHLDPSCVESWVAVIRDSPEQQAPLCGEAAALGCKTAIFKAPGKVNFSAVRQVREFIRARKIDILHTHFYKTDILGLMAVQGTSCRLISTPHGWSKEFDIKLWGYEMIDRLAFLFCDAVVPLSNELYRPLKRLPGLAGKLHCIQNGVDISEIAGVDHVAADIRAWKKQGLVVLGYIGQLIARKGLDVLFKALATLPSSIHWRLAVIGEGEKRTELEKAAVEAGLAERVVFFGFSTDRLAYLKGFDVFVLPSRLEGIPRCLMEAMAAGIPVVASDIPGITDLIEHGKTGLLFPVNDAPALAGTLTSILPDRTKRETLAKAALDHVSKKFSAQRMADEYVELYKRITGRSA